MPTWGQVLKETQEELARGNQMPFDVVRRRYLTLLHQYTKRNTILYASKWTQPSGVQPGVVSINDEDIQGLMEVVFQMKGDELDLILHSPGGSPEATEAIVSYLRSKFRHIRVIVPQAAMSAATMLSCAANRIVLGKHSSLGPIDPQIILQTPLGIQMIPAQAILDQFQRAQEECKNPQLLNSWLPILSQFGPALLVQCQNAIDLAKGLVEKWLHTYMFESSNQKLAIEIAKQLSSHGDFKSHGRHISLDQAQQYGLVVDALEDDHQFQERVLSVYHAAMLMFTGTAAVKILENHAGGAFLKIEQQLVFAQPPQKAPSILPPPVPPSPSV